MKVNSNLHVKSFSHSPFLGFTENSDPEMLARIFILLTLLTVCYCEHCGCLGSSVRSSVWSAVYKNVFNCQECEENYCKLGNYCGPLIAHDCYWSSQSNTCLRAGGILGSISLLKYFTILLQNRSNRSDGGLWNRNGGSIPLW